MAEAHVEVPLSVLAKRVRARAHARPGRYLLGIAGPPGAGKSTLSLALRDALNATERDALDTRAPIAEIAPMDGFHLSNAALRAGGALARKGEPDTFDAAGYVAALDALRRAPLGAEVPWPTFDRAIEEPVPGGVVFTEHIVAITEGNYLLLDAELTGDPHLAPWSSVREHLDECWYLDAPRDLLATRLLDRHLRGGRTLDQARVKVDDSDLRNADLVAATSVRADLVLCVEDGRYFTVAANGHHFTAAAEQLAER
ncbi:nucleoside/nucleotide kinase family protein [Nocardia panacis]|uniref:Nucleoside/nucleotide kinase family protein n=1 Tax=Nocardia panacis TaxID=2340916 RepID=A0A3A4KIK1_9NOCA|nr:nucleoside/nucleotide kinase family protein [Nocardia panacis]RJO76424.1 nucleoside/nucleotide kinase family protein [Nocardia panacis]